MSIMTQALTPVGKDQARGLWRVGCVPWFGGDHRIA
jgi:hypothetical protein